MTQVTLKDFIAETLKSISIGVREAQTYSKELDGIPIAIQNLDGDILPSGEQLVKFNISLQAENASEKTGTAGLGGTIISVVTGNLSVGASAQRSHTSVHSVEFSVPMQFNAYWAPKEGEA